MTVSSSVSKVIGDGNGSTTVWPFSFKVYDAAHLQVIYTDADGVEAILATGYSVSLNATQETNPGGTVTYSPAIASGTKLTVLRLVPYTQETDIKNQGGYYPEVLERRLDLTVMQVQQLAEESARSVKVDASSSTNPSDMLDEIQADIAAANAAAVAAAGSEADAEAAQVAAEAAQTGAEAGKAGAEAAQAAAEVAQAAAEAAAGSVGTIGTIAAQDADDVAITGGKAEGLSRVDIQVSGVSGSTFAPFLNMNVSESYAAGTGFHVPVGIISSRAGGTGHREAVHIEQHSWVAANTEFVVGLTAAGHIRDGSGQAFGVNGYGWIDAAADSDAACSGGEFDTDVRRGIVRKTGVQIADVATSTGSGSVIDAGLLICQQVGAVGYKNGIQFGDPATGTTGLTTGATVISVGAAGTVANGLDLSNLTITGGAIKTKTFAVLDGTATVNIANPDASSGAGPTLALIRDSASPAASDVLGQIQWWGRSSTNAQRNMGVITYQMTDPTNTSEDGQFIVQAILAGTVTSALLIGGNYLRPGGDNSVALGGPSNRWTTVYSATGTINTSDADAKMDTALLDDAEKRVARRMMKSIRRYRFRDAVAAKGDKARQHIGLIAQDVEAAFAAEGLNGFEYGLLCADDVDGQRRLGLRYDEAMMFILGSLDEATP